MAAQNEYGVETPSVELELTKTFHGVSIQLPSGSVIGRIQSFSPTFGERGGAHIYELNRATLGRPIDYVVGTETGRSISISRVEVWEDELEIALADADSEYTDLADQTKPFEIVESLFRGSSAYRAWKYRGCWFSSLSVSGMEAEAGDMRVTKDASINYVTRQKI